MRLFEKRNTEPPEFERALAALLTHKEYLLRRAAINALAKIEIELDTTVASLAKLLNRGDEGIPQLGAAGILLRYPQHEGQAVAEYVRAFKQDDAFHRTGTLLTLAQFGEHGKPLTPHVIKLLEEDPDSQVRGWAAYTLAAIKADPTIALPALSKALEDSDSGVREEALDALASYGPTPAFLRFVHAISSGGTLRTCRGPFPCR